MGFQIYNYDGQKIPYENPPEMVMEN